MTAPAKPDMGVKNKGLRYHGEGEFIATPYGREGGKVKSAPRLTVAKGFKDRRKFYRGFNQRRALATSKLVEQGELLDDQRSVTLNIKAGSQVVSSVFRLSKSAPY